MVRNYALIGDIHSQSGPLHKALSYCQSNALIPVLLGDVFDSRCDKSDSVGVYKLLRQAQKDLGAIVLRSNHQDKLERYLKGNSVKVGADLQRTVDDFAEGGVNNDEVLEWLESHPYGFCFKSDGVEYRCAHAYFPSKVEVPDYQLFHLVWDLPRKARQLAMYGPMLNESRERAFWWERATDRPWVRVAGHYHVVHSSDRSLILDAGCGDRQRSWVCDEPSALVLWDSGRKQMIELAA